MTQMQNKVVIITGASSGIGRAAARLFAAQGARLVVGARRKDELDRLVKEIASDHGEGLAVAVTGDVREEDFARSLVETALDRFGQLDAAFNNAGTLGEGKPIESLSLDQWQEMLEINLTGAFLYAKYQVPAMVSSGGGAILFTSTFVGYTAGMPGMAAYAASKAGLIGLMKVMAVELGPKNIRVNALLPGGTDTPMAKPFTSDPDTLDFVKGLHALNRLATPEEIAQCALYLSSDASSFVTGSAFLADGGVSVYRG